MFLAACSGFPIPVSRYFREFTAVEISDTELGLLGQGTIRRFLREASPGFAFSAVAPKVFADAGFIKTPSLSILADQLTELALSLDAQAVVFAGDESLKPTKPTRATLRTFIEGMPASMPRIVFDLPGFKTSQIEELSAKREVYAAHDPLLDELPKRTDFVYMRLSGPAGHRSRYDEESLDKLAAHCREVRANASAGLVIFRNIDMQTNAQQLQKKLDAP